MSLALHKLDAVVEQAGVELLGLFLGQLNVFERCGDLVVVEDTLVHAPVNQPLELFNLRESDLDSEHWPRFSRSLETGDTP